MGFTVRFILGTVLVLLCSWSIQTTELNRPIPQVSDNEDEKLEKNETKTQSIVANLTENNEKPKTDLSTDNKTIDKQNSVVGKLESSESGIEPTPQAEIGRSIDIEKYVSKEFHSKNNLYALPISPDTKKYIDPEYDFHATTHKHSHSEEFDFDVELTTPKSAIFDQKFKEAVESVDQKLEHIDDSHEISSESESKEINLEKLYDETLKNDTKANLTYVNYKNIVSNDTGGNNSLHKDLVVEAGTNLDFRSSYNHTTIIDEDDEGNNTIVKEPEEVNNTKGESSTLSNVIPDKGDTESAESLATKVIVPTTRKSIVLTKPPSNRNSSHISILSNNIETETVKAINPVSTTEKPKGEETSEVFSKKTPVDVSKRFFMFTEASTESTVDTNHIGKKSEQLLQENQVIPVHVEAPPKMKSNFTTEESLNNATEETLLKNETTERLNLETTTVATTETVATTVHQIEVLLTSTTPKTVVTEQSSETTSTDSPVTEVTTVEAETKSTLPSVETTTLSRDETVTTVETDKFTTDASNTEVETVTSVVTETSVSPWERATTQSMDTKTTPLQPTTTLEPEVQTTVEEVGTTMFLSTYLSDSTAASITTELPITTDVTTVETTTEKIESPTITTENTVRTSKGMVYNDTTPSISVTTEMAMETTEILTTESPETTTIQLTTTEATVETTPEIEGRVTETIETTTMSFLPRNVPNVREETDSTEMDNTTDSNTMTSDSYEYTETPEDNGGVIAAITISSIAAVCLVLLAGLFVIMRKRQKRFNYGQRCTPVSLDDYSMDNVSVYNSVRRKGIMRGSKRSYGNPAFEDPVSVTHPLNFPALGKFANNLEDIKPEFEDIPQITARTNELPEGCDTKNRYANVIPLPETRVFLKPIEGYPNSDYINANYVTGPKNTKGYYIACQAPMQNTVDDFWRMIWEQQSKVILMLTHLFENGVEKCVDYLPPSEVLDCHRLFGDFQVTLKKREVKDKYIISSLQLKNMVSNSWREITHFWYMGWPEKGVPSEANSLIAFLIEARSYMKSSSIDRKDVTNGNLTNGMAKNELNPVVVHCSPGTGRTGVVIACDIAIREFEQTRLVDVPRIVYKIRRDRASAVQTKEQYAFIYKVINLYATKLTGGALDSL